MSGYPYGGGPPQYPPPNQNQIYPSINQVFRPYDDFGQPQVVPTPGFFPYPGQPGQHGQPGQPGQPMQTFHPAAMAYPGVAPHVPATAPTPSAPSYAYPTAFPNITPTPVAPTIEWVPTTPQYAQSLSDRAVVAGYEGHDGSPLWVIRAGYEGDLIPGKLAAKHRTAYVAWGGNENPVQSIEVCCAPPNRIRWVESRDGVIPPNAVVGGKTSAGEPLYIGRAREQGSLTPGKVHPSHKVLYISFAGKEIPHKTYEVLCTA